MLPLFSGLFLYYCRFIYYYRKVDIILDHLHFSTDNIEIIKSFLGIDECMFLSIFRNGLIKLLCFYCLMMKCSLLFLLISSVKIKTYEQAQIVAFDLQFLLRNFFLFIFYSWKSDYMFVYISVLFVAVLFVKNFIEFIIWR